MADVHNEKYCFNVKSIKEQTISKTGNRTIEFVQCRTPISNDRMLSNTELGENILRTLDEKLRESLEIFQSEKMIDIIILHKRYGDTYHATVYMVDHPDFNSYQLLWSNGEARLDDGLPWFIKRKWSDDSHRQTCTLIKRKYLKENIVAEITIPSLDLHSVSSDSILMQYNEYVNNEFENVGDLNGTSDSYLH